LGDLFILERKYQKGPVDRQRLQTPGNRKGILRKKGNGLDGGVFLREQKIRKSRRESQRNKKKGKGGCMKNIVTQIRRAFKDQKKPSLHLGNPEGGEKKVQRERRSFQPSTKDENPLHQKASKIKKEENGPLSFKERISRGKKGIEKGKKHASYLTDSKKSQKGNHNPKSREPSPASSTGGEKE